MAGWAWTSEWDGLEEDDNDVPNFKVCEAEL